MESVSYVRQHEVAVQIRLTEHANDPARNCFRTKEAQGCG